MKDSLRLALLRAAAWGSRPWARAKTAPESKPPRILLIRPDHMGDVLFATPAIRALRDALPDSHISSLVGPWAVDVLKNNPNLDEVLTCPFPGFTRRPKRHLMGPYVVLWRYARVLRSNPFDVALVMRFDHWWGAALAYWSAIPRRLGYDLASVAPFLTDATPYVKGRAEVNQNMALVSALVGHEVDEPGPLEFYPQPGALRSAAALLRTMEPSQGLLCLHPGAGAPVKLWRPQGYAQIGDALAREHGLQVVITGASSERELAESIAQQMDARPLVLAGRTTIDELAAVFARCRLVIGADSGPLHLAVSQRVPTIHLFGPTDSHLFGPWGDPARHLVVVSDMDCVPCNRLDYPPEELIDHPCVRSIPNTAVLEAAELLLRQDGASGESDGIIGRDAGSEAINAL
jgi:lipopolysaccharide heptosyltransferase II